MAAMSKTLGSEPDHDDFQAMDDAHTVLRAHKVMADRKRMKAAHRHLNKQVRDLHAASRTMAGLRRGDR